MNIYLDIDGVLLDKNGIVADHFEEFLEFFVMKHNVFWLTTHCHGGECDAVDHISAKNKLSPRALELLQKIKTTDFKLWKTEGIDFSKDFIWLDDYVFDGEKEALEKNGALQKLILIDLKTNPNQLADLIVK
jgi:hypothetical protein